MLLLGVAAKVGGSKTECQVLETKDSTVSSETSIKENTAKDSAKKIIHTIVEVAKRIKASGDFAAQAKIPVYISWAGDIKNDNGNQVLEHPNFDIENLDGKLLDKSERYNFQADLQKAFTENDLDINMIDLKIDNDGNWIVSSAASNFSELIPKGTANVNAISGTGYNTNMRMASGELISTEDGHELMDSLEENTAVEGPPRVSKNLKGGLVNGKVEHYVCGGSDDKPGHGAKATANFLIGEIKKDEDNSKLAEAMQLLGIESVEQAKSSKLMQLAEAITNEDLTRFAKEGDIVATKILEHTMKRLAHRVKLRIISKEAESKKTIFRLATVTGGFANDVPDSAKQVFEDVLNKDVDVERKIETRFFEPKLDGTYDVVMAKLQEQYKQFAN